jgi:hypothetical protein
MEKRSMLSPARDRHLVSDEPWEVEQIHRHFPKHTHDEVLEAINECKQELGGSPNRDKILECMQTRLLTQAADGVD